MSRIAAERVLWIDLEMTNILDVARGRIMEVGAVVTGPAMEWLTGEEERGVCTAYHRVIRLSEAELRDVSDWSRVQHAKPRPGAAGLSLLDLCARSSFDLAEVEDDLVALVRTHGRGRPMMLAGASVSCDRVFIDAHMPRLASVLHHRSIDVSTVLELCRRMYPGFRVPVPPTPLESQHTAMGDILSSLRLMHVLQNTIFMPVLIPSSNGGGGNGGPAGSSSSSSLSSSSQHHHYHGARHAGDQDGGFWDYSPARQPHQHSSMGHFHTPYPPQPRFRQAPAPHTPSGPTRPPPAHRSPLLAATAAHGFPLHKRDSVSR
jgi:oligoribonuclease (3'-5' exoribonuclease)